MSNIYNYNTSSGCCKACDEARDEKDLRRRIIALTGKDQYALELVQNYLTNIINVFKVKRVTSEELTTDEFLNKILKGDIIEASAIDDIIVGTSKSDLEPGYLYVGIYTPYQLSNLLECVDKNLEVLPVEIEMNPRELLNNLCERSDSIYEACEKYMKINDTYEGEEYLNDVVYLWKNYNTNKALYHELGNKGFEFHLKEFNRTHNLISNLDNFI